MPAFLAIPIVGGFTVGMAVQVVVVVYGAYKSRRLRKKAKQNEKKATFEDQKTTLPSSVMARTINYGVTAADGRVAKVVGASDAQPHFFIVKALTPDHEIDGFVDVLFDGAPVGPFTGDWYSDEGAWVTEGSRYYRGVQHTDQITGIIPESRVIQCKGPVVQVTGMVIMDRRNVQPTPEDLGMIPGTAPSGGEGEGGDTWAATNYWANYSARVHGNIPPPSMNAGIQGSTIVADPSLVGFGFQLTYVYSEGARHVRVWCRRGSSTQTVIPRISQVAPEWNANCRLRGIPYVAVEIIPHLDLFPNEAPDVTAIIRGKKVVDIRHGQSVFSRNAAVNVHDYLRGEIECTAEEIDNDLSWAAANACDEQVPTYDGGAPEQRYRCDVELSTENDMTDNLRTLLASMAGSATYAGTKVAIRAGVAAAPTFELDEDDLASGNWSSRPYTPVMEGVNCVRGTYTKYDERLHAMITSEIPPYRSAHYVKEDAGRENWEEINLPAVQSWYQAQRIVKLLMHLSRNSCSFHGQFKMKAREISAGSVVYYSHISLGFDAKQFMVRERKVIEGNNIVELDLVEMPTTAYAWNYQEGRDPDPAPNTNLPNPFLVSDITGLKAESGQHVNRWGPNGQVQPVMRVSWDRSKDVNVLTAGHIDVWHKTNRSIDFIKVRLPGDTTRHDVEVLRDAQVHIQVRATNPVAKGRWSIITHTAADSMSQFLTGQLLYNPEFASDPTGELQADRIWKWSDWGAVSGTVGSYPDPYFTRDSQPYFDGMGFGFLMFPPYGGAVVGSVYRVVSSPMQVTQGQRVVQYISGWSNKCRVFSHLSFHGQSDEFLGFGAYSTSDFRESPTNVAVPAGESLYKLIHGFGNAPPGSRSMRFWIVAEVTSQPADSVSAEIRAMHPYVGIAAEGQVTLPPWSP